ncbi:MAG: hypothetical protein M1825_003804 [Sarcosagium campestre]|nr:MAG: hypothetical protein M1825_003804 [Sarcosagium campestre]
MSNINTPPPKSQRPRNRTPRAGAKHGSTGNDVDAPSAQFAADVVIPTNTNQTGYQYNQGISYNVPQPPNQLAYPTDYDPARTPIQAQNASVNTENGGAATRGQNAQTRKPSHQRHNSYQNGMPSGSSTAHQSPQRREHNGRNASGSGAGNVQTPVKPAYAGPTFHASPAPSSLPLPSKLFSKSVPEISARTGLKAMFEEEEDKVRLANDASPSRSRTGALKNQPSSGSSPLDIFFKADREQKAKATGASPFGTPRRSPNSMFDPPSLFSDAGDQSPFPSSNRPHHSRTNTNNSGTGVFPMEMDANTAADKKSAHQLPQKNVTQERLSSTRAQTAPSNMLTGGNDSDEERRVKSQALKDLLWSTQTRRPATSSGQPGERSIGTPPPPAHLQSPSGKQKQRKRGNHSPVPVPSASPLSTTDSNNHNIHRYNPRLSAGTNLAAYPPVRSSNLRREVLPIKSPDGTDHTSREFPLPSSLNPPNFQGLDLHASGPQRNPTPSKQSLEDHLRQVLKLDNVENSPSGSDSDSIRP